MLDTYHLKAQHSRILLALDELLELLSAPGHTRESSLVLFKLQHVCTWILVHFELEEKELYPELAKVPAAGFAELVERFRLAKSRIEPMVGEIMQRHSSQQSVSANENQLLDSLRPLTVSLRKQFGREEMQLYAVVSSRPRRLQHAAAAQVM